MALLIVVNGELEELAALPVFVGDGDCVAFLTLHSLEDREAKRHFRSLACNGLAIVLIKHGLQPTNVWCLRP